MRSQKTLLFSLTMFPSMACVGWCGSVCRLGSLRRGHSAYHGDIRAAVHVPHAEAGVH